MRRIAGIPLALTVTIVLAGCGGSDGDETTTATQTVEQTPAEAVQEQNDAVIEQAEGSPDALAEEGEKEIRATLKKELGMTPGGDFNVTEKKTGPNEVVVGSDCYVKTGAEAINSSYKKRNMLYSPTGEGAVFVQTSTGTPLADCLVAVRDALGW